MGQILVENYFDKYLFCCRQGKGDDVCFVVDKVINLVQIWMGVIEMLYFRQNRRRMVFFIVVFFLLKFIIWKNQYNYSG